MNSKQHEYSLIIPVYKNEENISELLNVVGSISSSLENFEAIFVVDGSPDQSFALLQKLLPDCSFDSQLFALSRNFGSFAAIRHGMKHARGDYCSVLSADLQEPQELIQDFFAVLKKDESDIVVGARSARSDGIFSNLFSSIFWMFYRYFVQPEIPKGGVDIFACNKKVMQSILRLEEDNTSLIAQLFWVGFRRHNIFYERRKRLEGKSSWSFKRKIKYMLDSVFAFTDLPIMILLWVGFFGIIAAFLASLAVVMSWWMGLIPVLGYVPIILSILFIGSLMLFSQGIIGCYVWRANESTKRRPLSITSVHIIFDGKS